MALITCAGCGREFSNTLEACPHCGRAVEHDEFFGADGTQEADFNKLDLAEKEMLRQEFLRTHKGYSFGREGYRQCKKLNRACVFAQSFFVFWLAAMFLLAYALGKMETKLEGLPWTVFLMGFFRWLGWQGFGLIFGVYAMVRKKVQMKLVLRTEKIFQAWLKREKGMCYTVYFDRDSEKYKKYFDEIIPENYPD